MASLSYARLSAADEYGGEGAAGTPGGQADRLAPEGSPWEAKSPGDSPRSRIPARMDSTSGEHRKACTSLLSSTINAESCLLNHCSLSADALKLSSREEGRLSLLKIVHCTWCMEIYIAVMTRQSSFHLALSGLAGTLLGGLPDES